MREQAIWDKAHALATHLHTSSLHDLFHKDPKRFKRFSFATEGFFLDLSKQKINSEAFRLMHELALAVDFEGQRRALFEGLPVNESEHRPALHMALRAPEGSPYSRRESVAERHRVKTFVENFRKGRHQSPPIKRLVHIGIGGSDLGPRLLYEALKPRQSSHPDLRFVANLDPDDLMQALEGAEPEHTLFIFVSKSFSTLETLTNAQTACAWLRKGLGEHADLSHHCLAVTARRDRAEAFGLAPSSVFDIWDWVGGRTSVWSAASLAAELVLGSSVFEEFLAGAHAMDQHFLTTSWEKNLPVVLGFCDVWMRSFMGFESRALVPYARRLQLLPTYLQQVEMESNGKSTRRDGTPSLPAAPLVWGGEGTNGQHAFFQLLHQGQPVSPVLFLAILEGSGDPLQRRALLTQALAQSEALMKGKSEEIVCEELRTQGLSASEIQRLAPQKAFPGGRPSGMLLLDRLTPWVLGGLMALFEHKIFVASTLLGINAFDQWGVELGKSLAKNLETDWEKKEEDLALTHDPSTRGLMQYIRGKKL